MNDKEKIEKVLRELKIKAPTFAKNIDVPYSRVHDIQRGKTQKISADLAGAIASKYPQYSYVWLLSDAESEAIKTPSTEPGPDAPNLSASDVSRIADACQRSAATSETLAAGNDKLAELAVLSARTLAANAETLRDLSASNKELLDSNTEILNQLIESIALLREQIDKKGAAEDAGDAASKAVPK